MARRKGTGTMHTVGTNAGDYYVKLHFNSDWSGTAVINWERIIRRGQLVATDDPGELRVSAQELLQGEINVDTHCPEIVQTKVIALAVNTWWERKVKALLDDVEGTL